MDTSEEIEIIHTWIKETYKTSYLIQQIKDDYLVMFVGRYSVRVDVTVDNVFVWVTKPGVVEAFKWSDPKLFEKMKRFINGV
jgi:hypothetical protein